VTTLPPGSTPVASVNGLTIYQAATSEETSQNVAGVPYTWTEYNYQVYSSDGTTSGTQLLANVQSGDPFGGIGGIVQLATVGSLDLFVITSTSPTTQLVGDQIDAFTEYNYSVYTTDGTSSGTQLLVDVSSGSPLGGSGGVNVVAEAGSAIFFEITNTSVGMDTIDEVPNYFTQYNTSLYVVNAASGGPSATLITSQTAINDVGVIGFLNKDTLFDVVTGGGSQPYDTTVYALQSNSVTTLINLANVNGVTFLGYFNSELVFAAIANGNATIYLTDGGSATELLNLPNVGSAVSITGIAQLNSTLIFRITANGNTTVYATDGGSATQLLNLPNVGSPVSGAEIGQLGNTVIFSIIANGNETIYATDGSSATELLNLPNVGSNPVAVGESGYTDFGNNLMFGIIANGNATIYATDGGSVTQLLNLPNVGSAVSITGLAQFNSAQIFGITANGNTTVYTTDGSSATQLLNLPNVGGPVSGEDIGQLGNILIFDITANGNTTVYATDGNSATPLLNLPNVSSADIVNIGGLDNTLIFGITANGNATICATDGSSATQLLNLPVGNAITINDIGQLGNTLIFGFNSNGNATICATDGSSATELLNLPNVGSALAVSETGLGQLGNTLIFAITANGNAAIYATDGSSATQLLNLPNVGSAVSITDLALLSSAMIFDVTANGNTMVYATDGSSATQLLNLPNVDSANFDYIGQLNGGSIFGITANGNTTTFVASGDNITQIADLTITSGSSALLTLPNTVAPTVTVQSGGTLVLTGSFTTAQLASITNDGGTIEIEGLLDNTGATLEVGPGTQLGNVIIQSVAPFGLAAITGGNIVDSGGGLTTVTSSLLPVLAGVSYEGPLTLDQASSGFVLSGVTFTGPGGVGLGTISLTADSEEITFIGSQTFDSETIYLGEPGSTFDRIVGGVNLTLGPDVVVNQVGNEDAIVAFGGSAAKPSSTYDGALESDGTINVNSGSLLIAGDTFINKGAISISSGASVGIDSVGVGVSDASLVSGAVWSNEGTITLSAGGTLEFGGNFTTADLEGVTNGGGTLAVLGTLDNSGGTVDVGAGSSLGEMTLAGGTIAGGTLDVASSLSLPPGLIGYGTVTGAVTNAGWVEAQGGTLDLAQGLNGTGSAQVDAGSELELGGNSSVTDLNVASGGVLQLDGVTVTTDPVALDANASITGSGTITGDLTNDGVVTAVGGTLDLTGNITGSGTLEIAPGATLKLDGTVGVGQTIDFQGTNATLNIGQPLEEQGTITSFVSGDTLDISGLSSSDTVSYDATSGALQILNGTTVIASLHLSGNYQQSDFQLGDGTVSTDVACFYPGTLVATTAGSQAVESLAPGDFVLTTDGEAKAIRWLGRQTISTVFADPLRVLPIRIKAGALGENMPLRDLLLSPCHALLLDCVLIQAGALVNGTTIVRETQVPEIFTYYHIELTDHSLILAEGTPVETFVDNVDRVAFDNWAEHETLCPEGYSIVEMAYPRAKAYRQVPDSIRQRLAARSLVPVRKMIAVH
jgi:hypothetical protein